MKKQILVCKGKFIYDDFTLAQIAETSVKEAIYILPPDKLIERWTGVRIKPDEASELSCIENILFLQNFETDFHRLACSGDYKNIYFDFDKLSINEKDDESFKTRNVRISI